MTPKGLMIIGYPALICIIMGASLLCSLIAGIWLRYLPKWRIAVLVGIFCLVFAIITLWLYYQYHVLPIHIDVIDSLDWESEPESVTHAECGMMIVWQNQRLCRTTVDMPCSCGFIFSLLRAVFQRQPHWVGIDPWSVFCGIECNYSPLVPTSWNFGKPFKIKLLPLLGSVRPAMHAPTFLYHPFDTKNIFPAPDECNSLIFYFWWWKIIQVGLFGRRFTEIGLWLHSSHQVKNLSGWHRSGDGCI